MKIKSGREVWPTRSEDSNWYEESKVSTVRYLTLGSPTWVHSGVAPLYPRSAEAIIHVGKVVFFLLFFLRLGVQVSLIYSLNNNNNIMMFGWGAIVCARQRTSPFFPPHCNSHQIVQNARQEAQTPRAFLKIFHDT